MKAFHQMLRVARANNMPERYETDLTEHDRKRLASNDAPERFVWVLRTMGTLLLDPRMEKGSAKAYMNHLEQEKESSLFFVFRNDELVQVDKATAIAWFASINEIENKAQQHTYNGY